MPHMALKLEDAPIVLVRITGRLTPAVHFKVSQEVADLIEGVPGIIFRINDLTGVQLRVLEMAELVHQLAKGWAGTASDPRIVSIMVMDNPNMFLGLAHIARKWGWAQRIHVCPTVEEALHLARAGASVLKEVEADRMIV